MTFLDALFTSFSSCTETGLSVVDTSTMRLASQIMIVVLVQAREAPTYSMSSIRGAMVFTRRTMCTFCSF